MARSIERYLRMMPKAYRATMSSRLWAPPADVYRTHEGWIVKVELAGVSTDELEIEIGGATLRIRGCRRDTVISEGMVCQQVEITYSRFEKIINFPCPIEGASVEQDYNDGLLVLRLLSPERCD